jgi:hypothetical protein
VENAWLDGHYREAMEALGYPREFVNRISVNPDPIALNEHDIPVYLEQRKSKAVGDWIVSGKFDMVMDGQLYDIKTTKTYTKITGSNNRDYQLQGSIYRWLNPEIIQQSTVCILYIFTDWSPLRAKAESGGPYPKFKVESHYIPLLSLQETEKYIEHKLGMLKEFEYAHQEHLPECKPEELWQDPSSWAVYKDPSNTRKASRVLSNAQDAYIWNAQNANGQGLVVERPAIVRRCSYCSAINICEQAKSLGEQGLLAQ